ncbi:polysaccharide pyruvyl transferase family protein [Phocaeicola sp. HCN-40430]|uniref:polysaccharide pyruvyl transferase family protein n=1 Tax=Phocaeicola sp. HCN-40430 TaxID=3134664 RepID=UPI0030C33970
MNKLKVAFVGLYKEPNLGDPIIFDSTEWLYSQYLGCEIQSNHLYLDYIEKTYSMPLLKKIINKFSIKIIHKLIFQDNYQKRKLTKLYFEKKLKDIDLVVVVGGGIIKYSYQFFWGAIWGLLQAANNKKIPVILNAVGIEGYDSTNKKCLILKDAMHLPSLAYITTRDDLSTLIQSYFDNHPSIPVHKVCDPAVWISEIYNIKKNIHSNTIGIGVAREGIFIDNGLPITPSQLISLYCSLIKKLTFEGHKIHIFTNGHPADKTMALHICELLKKEGIIVNIDTPINKKELVKIISNYKAVIATRLHSCIISYSLNIPAIGLVWNDKLKLWGYNINRKDDYITINNFNANYIYERLSIAIKEGYNIEQRKEFRNTIINSILNIKELLKIN